MVRPSQLLLHAFLIVLMISIFSNCKKEEAIVLEPEERVFPKVDERLWHLFEAFEVEAAKRGFDVDLVREGIVGEIKAIPETHVAGRCSYSQNTPGRVTIDKDFFVNSNGNFQEFIIFHELGHCFLHRGHREDANEQGVCISLMRSGLEDCRDNYNTLTKKRYIDELFHPDRF